MRKRTIHKAAAALTALALCAGVLTGCGGAASSSTASSTAGSSASSEVSGEEADELAAKNAVPPPKAWLFAPNHPLKAQTSVRLTNWPQRTLQT